MPPTCYLHVGGYKTGTTYLQRRLVEGRDLLREHGVLVPGADGIGSHGKATRVILGWPDLKDRPVPPSAWYDLRDEMIRFEGQGAVLSCEELSAATKEQAARMVSDLGETDVRVVLTTRDFVRVIPAAWQELMKGGGAWTWPQYLDTLASRLGRTVPPGRGFWRLYDWVALAETWADAVGPDKITVVTVPPVGASPAVLWERYCGAISVDPDVLSPDLDPKNESLDAVACELLRRFNVRAADGLAPNVYVREVRRFVAQAVLASRSGGESVRLVGARNAWAREEGERIAAGLERLGVNVEGDLTDLVGTPDDRPPVDAPTSEEVLDAALHVMTALVGRLGERTAKEATREARRRRRGHPAEPEDERAAGPSIEPARPAAAVRARRLAGRLLRDTYERTRR